MRKGQVTVELPNLHPSHTLPKHAARVLRQMIDAGQSGVNTLQLHESGCLNTARSLARLRTEGAIIHKYIADAVDSEGELHHRVAHYIYKGWECTPDCNHGHTPHDEENAI